MADDRIKELNQLNKKQLCEKVVQLEDENAALKLVNGEEDVTEEVSGVEYIQDDKERTFKVGNKNYRLKNVPAVHFGGETFPIREVLENEELLEQLVEVKSRLIDKV